MSGRCFLDTNIVVYAHLDLGERSIVAKQVIGRGGVISVQVLNEFTNVMRRKHLVPWNMIKTWLRDVCELLEEPLPLTSATHHKGFEIASAHGLRIDDGLIVASGLEGDCDTLISEDMQHGRIFEGRLTVRNPFLSH